MFQAAHTDWIFVFLQDTFVYLHTMCINCIVWTQKDTVDPHSTAEGWDKTVTDEQIMTHYHS